MQGKGGKQDQKAVGRSQKASSQTSAVLQPSPLQTKHLNRKKADMQMQGKLRSSAVAKPQVAKTPRVNVVARVAAPESPATTGMCECVEDVVWRGGEGLVWAECGAPFLSGPTCLCGTNTPTQPTHTTEMHRVCSSTSMHTQTPAPLPTAHKFMPPQHTKHATHIFRHVLFAHSIRQALPSGRQPGGCGP